MFSDIYFAMSKNYFNKAGERKDWGKKVYIFSRREPFPFTTNYFILTFLLVEKFTLVSPIEPFLSLP